MGQALELGLRWLERHQSPEGGWSFNGRVRDESRSRFRAYAEAIPCVGATGLALLAFLGNGNTTRTGPYKDVVARGINWLREQQDKESGWIVDTACEVDLHGHALATLAICESYYFTRNPLLKFSAQRALCILLRPGHPYAAWRHDASATGWILLALDSTERSGLLIARDDLAEFFAGFGVGVAVGHDGDGCARAGLMDFLARRSLAAFPEAIGPALYFDALASQQLQGDQGEDWRRALERSLASAQSQGGDDAGSWNPSGAPGVAGGRVGATALALLALEVPLRFVRVTR